MATRMQQRRGTAAQWTAANPTLAAGEIGFETDNNRFKIGDGATAWADLDYFANSAALSQLLGDAPELLNTLEELASAMNDDPQFFTTINNTIDSHTSATTNIHGIADTSLLVDTENLEESISTALSAHNLETTNVHGIADTSLLATTADTATAISDAVAAEALVTAGNLSDHNVATTNVHGILDTADLATLTDVANAVAESTVNQESLAGVGIDWNSVDEQFDIDSTVATKEYADDAVSTHNDDTANVHGIADTAELETQTGAQGKADLAQGAAENYTDTAIGALTSASVGLGNVDDTSDANKPVSTATQTALDAKLSLSGGTMTGDLTLSGAPSSSLHAATKQYVDNTASGVVAKPQVLGATTANIDATYSNGTAGVGATLTHNTNGAFPAEAGGASGWAVGKGILVKNQTNKAENGRYYISDMGSASTPYVLTRCGYCDEANEIPGAYIFVQDGTSAGTGWIQVVSDPATFVVGTDNIDVFQFSGSGTITAGTNISVSGNEVSLVATPSLSGVSFSDGTQTKEGVPSRTPIVQKSASYALSTLTHRDSLIEVDSTSGTTITVPLDSSVDYPIGTTVDILQTNTGQVTIAGAVGVTVNATPGLKLRTRWSSCTLMKRAANTWVVYGDLTA